MSLYFAQILQDDLIAPIMRKTAYGLATTCVLGAAVYAGYRVAGPEKAHVRQHRHPELNDQVSYLHRKIIIATSHTKMTLIITICRREEKKNLSRSFPHNITELIDV